MQNFMSNIYYSIRKYCKHLLQNKNYYINLNKKDNLWGNDKHRPY